MKRLVWLLALGACAAPSQPPVAPTSTQALASQGDPASLAMLERQVVDQSTGYPAPVVRFVNRLSGREVVSFTTRGSVADVTTVGEARLWHGFLRIDSHQEDTMAFGGGGEITVDRTTLCRWPTLDQPACATYVLVVDLYEPVVAATGIEHVRRCAAGSLSMADDGSVVMVRRAEPCDLVDPSLLEPPVGQEAVLPPATP